MYRNLAKYYDKIYSGKNYRAESKKILILINKHKKTNNNDLLDAACGTGNHTEYLKKYCNVTGLDIDSSMLNIAKKKFPDVKFIKGDMRSFRLNKEFGAIVCLFSAIAHLTTKSDVVKAIKNFSNHLVTGGVLIIEGFITPDAFKPDMVHDIYKSDPGEKIYRINITKRKGNIAIVDFHFLVGNKNGIKYIKENHKLAMYDHKFFLEAMEEGNLEASYIENGLLPNRGLYIGVKK